MRIDRAVSLDEVEVEVEVEVELLDDLAVALQQHDEDIKSRLDHVDEQLQELKTLLPTPQGKRPGWNGKPE